MFWDENPQITDEKPKLGTKWQMIIDENPLKQDEIADDNLRCQHYILIKQLQNVTILKPIVFMLQTNSKLYCLSNLNTLL